MPKVCENEMCGRALDHPSHYRNCVPKKWWPASMLAPKVYATPEGAVVTVERAETDFATLVRLKDALEAAPPLVAIVHSDEGVEFIHGWRCNVCDYKAKTEHGLKVHVGKFHKAAS